MTFFQRYYVGIAAVVVLILWALSKYVFDAAEGWPRGLWVLGSVLAFGLICYLGNRSQGSLNDKANDRR